MMKLILTTLITGLFSTTLLANIGGLEDRLPKTVEKVIGVSDVLIPGGFNSDSDIFAVVSGVFPNGCYDWKGAEVEHKDGNVHEVRSIANVSQGMCLMALIPFTKEVDLGKLGAGLHRIRFINGDGTYLEKTLDLE